MSRRQWSVAVALLVGAAVWWGLGGLPVAIGQETPPSAVAAQPQSTTLWQLIKVGGWCMWPLGAFSIASVALVIRSFLMLKQDKLLRPDLVPHLREQMAARDVFTVRDTCQKNPCLLTSVLSAGLERVTGEGVDLAAVTEAMEEASTEEVTSYMTPINYLSILGVVSPMVGLLGTVSGMIKAFQNISAGGMGKPEVLAGNIGEALVTTAAGLIIAIPTMIFYYYFKNSFLKTMATLGRITGSLMDALRTGQLPPVSPG